MPGLKTTKQKHEAISAAILDSLRAAKAPMTYEQLLGGIGKRVPKAQFPTEGSLSWYTKTVQLDLEHQGKIERVEKPLRFKLSTGKKRNLRQLYHMKAAPKEVWQMLVDPGRVTAWSGAPAVMDGRAGTRFSLWDGDIYGENLEVVSQRELVQRWQIKGWKEPTTVTFRLRKTGEGSTVELLHTGIPEKELEEIAQGWDEHYLGAIKRQLEG